MKIVLSGGPLGGTEIEDAGQASAQVEFEGVTYRYERRNDIMVYVGEVV